MEKQNESNLQKTLIDSFQNISKLSIDTMQPLIQNMFETASNVNASILDGNVPSLDLSSFQKKKSNCCPPVDECPPHCIATFSREARSNERIIVPFLVKNTCATQKTYRVGVRELADNNGQPAPNQPRLNKTSVTLEPGRSESVLMGIDLANFNEGTYVAEIVLREKDINQNICFTLHVTNTIPITVSPFNEKQYKQKWLNWQSHFYCDPPKTKNSDNVIGTHLEQKKS